MLSAVLVFAVGQGTGGTRRDPKTSSVSFESAMKLRSADSVVGGSRV